VRTSHATVRQTWSTQHIRLHVVVDPHHLLAGNFRATY
jgi:hypothetical protein